MAIRARIDRHKCVGAGNCITLAPTAFDWLAGDYGKSDVVGADSIDEELLRAAAFACPTAAVVLEDISELLPWQLRGKSGPTRRVMKTFMFTDIVGSTSLAEALGDQAWEAVLRKHDDMLRERIAAAKGEVVNSTGDGFFVAFDGARTAIDCAIGIQQELRDLRAKVGFACPVRIGLHSAEANRRGADYSGMGVHVAARVAALAGGGEILATSETIVARNGIQSSPGPPRRALIPP
jgi:class 3 adenylate cyclase